MSVRVPGGAASQRVWHHHGGDDGEADRQDVVLVLGTGSRAAAAWCTYLSPSISLVAGALSVAEHGTCMHRKNPFIQSCMRAASPLPFPPTDTGCACAPVCVEAVPAHHGDHVVACVPEALAAHRHAYDGKLGELLQQCGKARAAAPHHRRQQAGDLPRHAVAASPRPEQDDERGCGQEASSEAGGQVWAAGCWTSYAPVTVVGAQGLALKARACLLA